VDVLEEAVLCSFAWDADWLLYELGLAGIKTTWVGDRRCRNRELPKLLLLNAEFVFPAQPVY
jgi:hypothetical protein